MADQLKTAAAQSTRTATETNETVIVTGVADYQSDYNYVLISDLSMSFYDIRDAILTDKIVVLDVSGLKHHDGEYELDPLRFYYGWQDANAKGVITSLYFYCDKSGVSTRNGAANPQYYDDERYPYRSPCRAILSPRTSRLNTEWILTYASNNASGGLMRRSESDKLEGIENGAQVNKIESISINGVEQEIANKNVDIDVVSSEALDEEIERATTAEQAIADDVDDIQAVIPAQATSTNKLADKAFVNSSLNSITAFYITSNADGDGFDTYADLAAATVFYSGGEVRVPTRNDYCIVRVDETKDNATTRYIFQNDQWEYQYTVNETALTAAQMAALNSGITSGLVALIGTAVQPADLETKADTTYVNIEVGKRALQTALTAEIGNRQTADAALQAQIDTKAPTSALDDYLPKTGGQVNGTISFGGATPGIEFLNGIGEIKGYSGTGTPFHNMKDPQDPKDGANKKYVDAGDQIDLKGGSISVYWANNGNDENDGISSTTPIKTINRVRELHSKYYNGSMNVIMSWGYAPTLPSSGAVEFHNSTVKLSFDTSQSSGSSNKIDLAVGNFALKFYDCDVTFNRINFTNVTVNNSVVFSNCRVTWDADIHATCNTTAVWCSDGFIAIGRNRSVSLNHTPASPNSDNTGLFQVVGSTVLVGKSSFITGSVYRLFDGREVTGNVANAVIMPTSASYTALTRTASSGTFARYANVLTAGNSASSNI